MNGWREGYIYVVSVVNSRPVNRMRQLKFIAQLNKFNSMGLGQLI